jgi:hypothetical protein
MKPKRIKEIISKAADTPGKWDKNGHWKGTQPLFIWGPPGVGKSQIVQQVTTEKGIGFLDTRASQHDPTDFRGIPAVIDGKAQWLPPVDIPFLNNDHIPDKGIWLLDEITSAPPLVQAVLYQATLDHQIGEHKLKEGWYTIAAGNRIEDRAVVYRMSTALANRFSHVEYDVNLEDWTDWAIGAGLESNVIAFINWRSELLFAFNPESNEKAFCSPRSWEFASNIIKMSKGTMLQELLEGTVGKGAAAEFTAFLKVQTELPNLDTIFKGDNFVPKRMDLRYALVSALVTKATAKQFERLLQYSENLPAEFSVLLAMMMVGKDEEAVSNCPSWDKWAKDHRDVLVRKRS